MDELNTNSTSVHFIQNIYRFVYGSLLFFCVQQIDETYLILVVKTELFWMQFR